MDFELYSTQNSKVALEESSPNSRNSWNIHSDGSMDNNDEYFDWTNSLKIDDDDNNRTTRKRKLSVNLVDVAKVKNANGFKSLKDPLDSETTTKHFQVKKANAQNGGYIILKRIFFCNLDTIA